MSIDDEDAAIAVVRNSGEVIGDPGELAAAQIPEFPDLWYVTVVEGGRPVLGGVAYVVHRPTGEMVVVPGSRPPRLNCGWVMGKFPSSGS